MPAGGAHVHCTLALVASLHRLPTFARDRNVHVVVECPRGSGVKLKYEPTLGEITFGRTLPYGLVYPFDFGFVPGTRAEDGDPLDALVVCDVATAPGVVVVSRPIGMLEASQRAKGSDDRRVRNDRVLFVAVGDRSREHIGDVSELPPRMRDEICEFFVAAVALENKGLEILGWAGAREAHAAIEHSRAKR